MTPYLNELIYKHAKTHDACIKDILSNCMLVKVYKARSAIWAEAHAYNPKIYSSYKLADLFNRDDSTVRHSLRKSRKCANV